MEGAEAPVGPRTPPSEKTVRVFTPSVRPGPFLLAVPLFLSGCMGAAPPSDVSVQLTELATGLAAPVYATVAPDGRLYIVEQEGRILVMPAGGGARTTFLDIQDRIANGGERGLLGLAFHPDFKENHRFFVHYTDTNGDTVLARYTGAGPGDEESEHILLRQDQPESNHNGGMIMFGRDGYLYMGLGDGGGGGDRHGPAGNGQNLETLLGKILRLDVEGDTAACPSSNPDLGDAAQCEIWAYGLRNPWRMSFDRETGDLWIGDVGQNQWEEVDLQRASSKGGENYGWNLREGAHTFRAGNAEGLVDPVFEYDRSGGCAVTGGYVYRGRAIPGLEGQYVFADYCGGDLWTLRNEDGDWNRYELLSTGMQISSFGEDAQGEILVVDHGGAVHRLVAA